MPHKPYSNARIQLNDRDINFRYECWKNEANRDGAVFVEGNTKEDHQYLMSNRVDIADALKYQEDLDSMRYFEGQGNGRSSEMRLSFDESGRVTDVFNPQDGYSNREVSEIGQKIVEQEHEYNTNLALQEIQDKPEFPRINNDVGPER